MVSIFFSSLVITLREGVEGALAVGIVLLYLRKTGRMNLAGSVWTGLFVALAASLAGAYGLQRMAVNNEVLEGVLMFAAAFFVTTMIVWMWRSARGLKKEIEARVEEIASDQNRGRTGMWLGIFLFTFLMIFREGIETVIFLSAVNFSTNALVSFLGGILGLALAVLFGVFFVRGSVRIDLGRFFKITGIVLMLFVIQLIIGGVHELSEGGVFDIGQKGMAIVGPIVKNNALFLIGILLIPVLLLLIPARAVTVPITGSQSEQRLYSYQQKKQKMWRAGAALLSMLFVLFIAFDFVYGQTRKLSEPVPLAAVDGNFAIPLSQVSDGHLHRFIDPSTGIRIIVMKDNDGKIATAFDACEICGSQGYVEEAGVLICLNCSADINPATISSGGGCNPIPLRSRIEGDQLIVNSEDLKEHQAMFH